MWGAHLGALSKLHCVPPVFMTLYCHKNCISQEEKEEQTGRKQATNKEEKEGKERKEKGEENP